MTTETISLQELKQKVSDRRVEYLTHLDELISKPMFTESNYKDGVVLTEKLDELRWVLTLFED